MMTHGAATRIVFFGISDCGLQRQNNEDHFIVADLTRKAIGVEDNRLQPNLLHHEVGEHGTLLAVADGLGGHEGGEIASLLAVDTVVQALFSAPADLPLTEQLIQAVMQAHEVISQYHGNRGHQRRMASTLTAIHIGGREMTIAHVGDSRAYRFGNGRLTLLTEDQTVVRMMQKKGFLTEEEAQHHPHRNVILQALGQDKSVTPDVQTLPVQDGDCLLLCSDGLTSYVSHEQIENILVEGQDEYTRCRRLIDAANAAGGGDNITVLLARVIVPASAEGNPNEQPQRPNEDAVPEAKQKSLWTTEIKLPWGNRTAQPEEPNAVETTSPKNRTTAFRVPWFQKNTQSQGSPVEDAGDKIAIPTHIPPAKPSLWQREIKWPWGYKGGNQPQPAAPQPPPLPSTIATESHRQFADPLLQPSVTKPSLLRLREKKVPTNGPVWNPNVLKFLEDHLAQHIGPVAKILVGRAATQTEDIQELCQKLATQLPSPQEQQTFLDAVANLIAHHKR